MTICLLCYLIIFIIFLPSFHIRIVNKRVDEEEVTVTHSKFTGPDEESAHAWTAQENYCKKMTRSLKYLMLNIPIFSVCISNCLSFKYHPGWVIRVNFLAMGHNADHKLMGVELTSDVQSIDHISSALTTLMWRRSKIIWFQTLAVLRFRLSWLYYVFSYS